MISKLISRALLKIIANSLAVVITIFLVKEIKLTGLDAIVMTILLLTVANSLVKPLVRLLVIPLRIVSLGLLNLVINLGLLIFGIALNTGLFYMVNYIYPENITIVHFLSALKAGLVIAVANWIFGWFSK